ncbi:phosphatidylserine decarboxylase proenzyme, mitochondrial isoform X2 [Venturia canescens]|uniref:phosphatidylserine decarboxylase proenzyme, mitochondrial isoform X2 n=1 Tax=Venturia canescens TaxID=32260 RepID=UPI001C9C4855|nr:phosphatidylserine decarboxylase proenzyme, mitochondrial isoform X2 [Venturia canescens]
MKIYRIAAVIYRFSSYVTLRNLPKNLSRNIRFRSSVTKTNVNSKKSTWFGILWKRWEFRVPLGVGVTLLGVLQWRHLRKHPYAIESKPVKGPVTDLMVECYCCLPLRITSRIFGWLASIELPIRLRPMLYNLYAKSFQANLQEIDDDLSTFPSLVDFFVRSLKKNARPINPHTNIVSPSDGRVLHFGKVASCRVEQVKGITYNLRHFLGDSLPDGNIETGRKSEKCDDYVCSLLKDPNNCLYQLIVYLAPGDYHRFHSPTDWSIHHRRHFQGKLLSVNPRIASWLPDLFAMNERVVYTGEWEGGFMAYAAVGATNVGSIKVYCDRDLTTNQRKWPNGKVREDANLELTRVKKGELFGEFRMGSTIVLLFEAPKDFSFSLTPGQQIKVGESLTDDSFLFRKTMRDRSNLNRGIAHALGIIINEKSLTLDH